MNPMQQKRTMQHQLQTRQVMDLIKLPKDQIAKLQKLRTKMEEKSLMYEQENVYEKAYLAKWMIVERTLNECYLWHRQKQKYVLMESWIHYFDGWFNGRPVARPDTKMIGSIPLKTAGWGMPIYTKYICVEFRECPSLKVLADPKKKYRIKRDGIGHKTDSLEREQYYSDFLPMVEAAIDEVFRMLMPEEFYLAGLS